MKKSMAMLYACLSCLGGLCVFPAVQQDLYFVPVCLMIGFFAYSNMEVKSNRRNFLINIVVVVIVGTIAGFLFNSGNRITGVGAFIIIFLGLSSSINALRIYLKESEEQRSAGIKGHKGDSN